MTLGHLPLKGWRLQGSTSALAKRHINRASAIERRIMLKKMKHYYRIEYKVYCVIISTRNSYYINMNKPIQKKRSDFEIILTQIHNPINKSTEVGIVTRLSQHELLTIFFNTMPEISSYEIISTWILILLRSHCKNNKHVFIKHYLDTNLNMSY